jgi:hypothetical protein
LIAEQPQREAFVMYWREPIIAALAGFILCASANATVVTSTFCFGPMGNCSTISGSLAPSPTTVGNGAVFNGSNGGTITAYAYQASNGSFVTPAMYNGIKTENGLFEVNDKYNNHGVGIAPYNPTEGTSNGTFSAQDGLTDVVPHTTPTANNFLLLQLGSNIQAGSTISFLLQAGVTGDTFDVYRGGSTTPTSFSGMTKMTSTPIHVDEGGTSMPNGTSLTQPFQYSITKNLSGVQWVAIAADCHYLVLDQVKTSYNSVPEPRFYGLLMAGMLGLAAVYARKRQAAVQTPSAL